MPAYVTFENVVVCVAHYCDDGSFILRESEFVHMMNDRHPDTGSRVCNTHHIEGYEHLSQLLREYPDDIAKLEYIQRDFNHNWARWDADAEFFDDEPGHTSPVLFAFLPLSTVDSSLLSDQTFDINRPAGWEEYMQFRRQGRVQVRHAQPEAAEEPEVTKASTAPQRKAWLL